MRQFKMICLGLSLTLIACGDKDDVSYSWSNSNNGGNNFNGPDDTDDDTADTSDTTDTTDTNETGEPGPDSGEELGVGEFDNPGDVVVEIDEDDGITEVVLSDAGGESNTGHEFYLVMVNPNDETLGFSLDYAQTESAIDTGGGSEEEPASEPPQMPTAPAASKIKKRSTVSPQRQRLRQAIKDGKVKGIQPPAVPPPPFTSADVGIARQEFSVRDSLDDEMSYERIEAKLWAVGDTVAIWVDEAVAIDWDYDCDGTIDQPAVFDSFGFDNCDLQTIANIVDVNIFPNITTQFGDASDMNSDSKVSVVISPVLNQMTRTSSDEEVQLVGSYADPEVDLNDYDPDENPGSDGQEVIYVFAPDPYGFHNPNAQTTIQEYTDVSLGYQIARAYFRLISYNQHVLVNEGEAEAVWVTEGMAALAADLVGYGSPNYRGVWDYLDAPHLHSLTSIEETGAISTSTFGPQYLFFRWIADAFGTEALQGIVQSEDTDVDNIATVLDDDFVNLVLKWQLAMLSTNSTTAGTGLPISPEDFPPYAAVTTVSAPVGNPQQGDLYGANGYQVGIEVSGVNYYYEGGTTLTPTENESNRVLTAHQDHSTFLYGKEFYGSIKDGYGAQVVRIADVPFSQTALEIRASTAGYTAAIIRAEDPGVPDYAKDVLYAPSDANSIQMATLPANGDQIYAVGEISSAGLTVSVDPDETETQVSVYDTDRYRLSLSNYAPGQLINIAVWLDYRYASISGDIDLADPWLAVVPESYLPVPTVTGTQSGACTDGISFGYPYRLLEHLYAQVMLAPDPYTESDLYTGASELPDDGDTGSAAIETFDPCGSMESEATTCEFDWDRDGVLDENEPQPETFLQQVQVMQCTMAGGDLSSFVPVGLEIIDADQSDEDSLSSYDRTLNIGGTSAEDKEGAFLKTTVMGGEEYIIVVGSSSGTGPYELTVQRLPE